ncbi:type II toxin-antitoxin system RelE/ParE family toxin, partial [Acinetobacter baumannii]
FPPRRYSTTLSRASKRRRKPASRPDNAACPFPSGRAGGFDEIADYLARHDDDRAIAFVPELQLACRRYADFPRSGRDCGHIFPGLRRFPH